MLVAPGPMEDVQAKVPSRFFILAYAEAAAKKLLLNTVTFDVLSIEKANQRVSDGQPFCVHGLLFHESTMR
jgi:hypothetical protein